MLKSVFSLFFVAVLSACTGPNAVADDASSVAADRLEQRLNEVTEVSFFFVSRTGNYDFSDSEIREYSSITLLRKCGGGCSDIMKPIIDHLRSATLAECISGEQTTLLLLGDNIPIRYSFSSRMIEFEDKCYFSETGLRKVLREDHLIFP